MRDEQKAALLADLEQYVIRPIGEGELGVRDAMQEFGLSHSAAFRLLENRVARDGWVRRDAIVNGRNGYAYRKKSAGDKLSH